MHTRVNLNNIVQDEMSVDLQCMCYRLCAFSYPSIGHSTSTTTISQAARMLSMMYGTWQKYFFYITQKHMPTQSPT
jgi:hypothetical protein